jgi:aquaporin Z
MNKFLVEFLGSLFFIFIILAIGNPIAIGSALTLAILLGGKISGGHFNPAVSTTMAMAGKLPVNDLALYVLSQVAGGAVAFQLHKRIR